MKFGLVIIFKAGKRTRRWRPAPIHVAKLKRYLGKVGPVECSLIKFVEFGIGLESDFDQFIQNSVENMVKFSVKSNPKPISTQINLTNESIPVLWFESPTPDHEFQDFPRVAASGSPRFDINREFTAIHDSRGPGPRLRY